MNDKKENIMPEQLEDEYFEKENLKNSKKDKKSLVSLFIILVSILLIIGGIATYFIINLNKPENIIKDFGIYLNNRQWDKLAESVDIKAAYALGLLEESQYTEFDTRYKNIENDASYPELENLLNAIKGKEADILSQAYKDVTLDVGEIESSEKIENTKSLYKVKVQMTFKVGENEQKDIFDIYVAKIDKKYKIIGGEPVAMIELAYMYFGYNDNN